MSREPSIWLDCAMPGCPRGTFAQVGHLSNLLVSGGWYCHGHDTEEEL